MSKKTLVSVGLIVAALVCGFASAACAYDVRYTTTPSYPHTRSGENSASQSVTWSDGGHISCDGTPVLDACCNLGSRWDFHFHDNTVCDAIAATSHTTMQKITVPSSAVA